MDSEKDREQRKQDAFQQALSANRARGWRFDPQSDDEYDAAKDEMGDGWQDSPYDY